jgi:hypothetical protein
MFRERASFILAQFFLGIQYCNCPTNAIRPDLENSYPARYEGGNICNRVRKPTQETADFSRR